MTAVPAAVEDAVATFVLDDDSLLELRPPKPTEWSVLFKWGVRVLNKVYKGRGSTGDPCEQLGWICLGSQACRDSLQFYPFYGDKTSNATGHLKDAHGVLSVKTESEMATKRSRDDEIEYLTSTPMFENDPTRLHLLVQTRRIVLNNLPFVFGEYDDSTSSTRCSCRSGFEWR